MVVRWVQCLTPFQALPESDRHLLLEETWTQLFLVHLAQWSISEDISRLLEDEQVCQKLQDSASRQELVIIQVMACSKKDYENDINSLKR